MFPNDRPEVAIAETPAVKEASDHASELAKLAIAAVITNDADLEIVSLYLKDLAGIKKSLEEQRQFFVRPLNDQVGKINALFKEFSAPILEADALLRKKVIVYREAQAEFRRKEQARLDEIAAANRREQARLEAEAKKAGAAPPPKVEVPAPYIQPAPKTVGNVTARKVWKWTVTDEDLIPRKYMMIDTATVGMAVREGEREIPGVRIYEEEVVSVR